MQTLQVALANRSYPIHIGRNLISNAELILPHLKRKHVAIVTNTTVAPVSYTHLDVYKRQQQQAVTDAPALLIACGLAMRGLEMRGQAI